MDKYRPCPSIIAMFTSDSQHPPKSKHAVYLGGYAPAKFEVAMSNGLGGDTFTRKYII